MTRRPAVNDVDRNGPPDGDFAAYIERLSGNAGAPGRVEPAGSTKHPRRAPEPVAGRRAGPVDGAGAADRAAIRTVDADALLAVGRTAGARLSRWLAIGGIALIALAVLDIVPRMSPLPGVALLVLSFFLRRLSRR